MNQEAGESIWRRIVYWTAATVGITVLFSVIFLVASWIETSDQPFHRVWGLCMAGLGLLFLAFAVINPKSLWRRRFRPEHSELTELLKRDDIDVAMAIPAEFIGTGLLVAGVAYAITGQFVLLLGAWVIIGLAGIAIRRLS